MRSQKIYYARKMMNAQNDYDAVECVKVRDHRKNVKTSIPYNNSTVELPTDVYCGAQLSLRHQQA